MVSGREARMRTELDRRFNVQREHMERQKRSLDRLTLMNIEAMSALFQLADTTVPKLTAEREATIKAVVDAAKDSIARIARMRETDPETLAAAITRAREELGEVGQEPTTTEEETHE
jgi:hypothetical protein